VFSSCERYTASSSCISRICTPGKEFTTPGTLLPSRCLRVYALSLTAQADLTPTLLSTEVFPVSNALCSWVLVKVDRIGSGQRLSAHPFQQDVANSTLLHASDLASRTTIPPCVHTHKEKEGRGHPNQSKYGYCSPSTVTTELTDLIAYPPCVFDTPQYSDYHMRLSRRFSSTFPSFRGRRCIVGTWAQSETCGSNPPPRFSGSEQGICWR